jgi:hypothetical protein
MFVRDNQLQELLVSDPDFAKDSENTPVLNNSFRSIDMHIVDTGEKFLEGEEDLYDEDGNKKPRGLLLEGSPRGKSGFFASGGDLRKKSALFQPDQLDHLRITPTDPELLAMKYDMKADFGREDSIAENHDSNFGSGRIVKKGPGINNVILANQVGGPSSSVRTDSSGDILTTPEDKEDDIDWGKFVNAHINKLTKKCARRLTNEDNNVANVRRYSVNSKDSRTSKRLQQQEAISKRTIDLIYEEKSWEDFSPKKANNSKFAGQREESGNLDANLSLHPSRTASLRSSDEIPRYFFTESAVLNFSIVKLEM